MDVESLAADRMEFRYEAPFEVTRSATDGDGLTMEGYASVFDAPTEIDSYEGRFIETIQRGAFARTIKARTPVLMFNHGKHPMIGDMPIGSIKALREDARGLFVRARMASNWLVEPVREAIAEKAINGMSFRMQVVNDKWNRRSAVPERTITEVRCPELGPVVFPAYTETSVSVRSREIAEGLSDPEVRAELARIFALGTSLERPAEAGTRSEDPPAADEDPPAAQVTPRVTDRERRIRALQLRGVIPS